MALSKEEKKIVERQNKELRELVLERTEADVKEIIRIALDKYVRANIDVITEEEKRTKFNHLVFG